MRRYGIGPQMTCAVLAELGDTSRFSSSRKSVRFAGPDVTVHESDTKRRAGHLSRQGPPVLRWGRLRDRRIRLQAGLARPRLLPRAQAARRRANRVVLSVARKLLRRAHHTLRELGDDALAPSA